MSQSPPDPIAPLHRYEVTYTHTVYHRCGDPECRGCIDEDFQERFVTEAASYGDAEVKTLDETCELRDVEILEMAVLVPGEGNCG